MAIEDYEKQFINRAWSELMKLLGWQPIVQLGDFIQSEQSSTENEVSQGANAGGGEGIFKAKTDNTLQFKSLVAGSNITLTPATDTVTIATSGSGETNTASNLGAGTGIFASKSGVDLQFKSLKAGTRIGLSSDANEITISTTGEANTAANLGTGEGIFSAKVSEALNFKSLKAGTNITLSSDANEITINGASGGITGTGSDGGVAFWTGASTQSHDSTNLFWDNTNKRLGIGVNNPAYKLVAYDSAITGVPVLQLKSGTQSAAVHTVGIGSPYLWIGGLENYVNGSNVYHAFNIGFGTRLSNSSRPPVELGYIPGDNNNGGAGDFYWAVRSSNTDTDLPVIRFRSTSTGQFVWSGASGGNPAGPNPFTGPTYRFIGRSTGLTTMVINAVSGQTSSLLNFLSEDDSESYLSIGATGKISMSNGSSTGTPGAATINQLSGTSAFAIGADSVTITNNRVTVNSHVYAIIRQAAADATLTYINRVNVAAGSFTVYGNATATAATSFSWFIIN